MPPTANTDPKFQAPDLRAAHSFGQQQIRTIKRDADNGHDAAIVAPDGFQVLTLPKRKDERPEFLEANPTFYELYAFLEYVADFKDKDTRIFCDRSSLTMTAVLDYHRHGSAPTPRHGDHVATLCLQYSEEWQIWTRHSGEAMGQVDFAEFIEDNAEQMINPDAPTMLELATNLQATKDAKFSGKMDLSSGSVSMGYEEEIQGSVHGGKIEIPKTIVIGLRPFEGTKRYQVDARFRYRLSGGAMRLHYKLIGLTPIIEGVWEEMRQKVKERVGIDPAPGRTG